MLPRTPIAVCYTCYMHGIYPSYMLQNKTLGVSDNKHCCQQIGDRQKGAFSLELIFCDAYTIPDVIDTILF